MAQTYKRLGALVSTGTITTADQLVVASNTALTSMVLSTIVVCNQAGSPATYRICISTTTGFAAAGYLVYGSSVPANESMFLTLGVTLDPSARYLLCSASASTVSFSAFGVENT